MGRHENSNYSRILSQINEMGRGKVFFNSDFPDFSSEEVRLNLSRLANEGTILRLSKGIYLYPNENRFGVEYPSEYEIAKAIARRDNAMIIPAGMTAANELGLSEQVPVKSVYLTDGSDRSINVNGREIVFKRVVPANFDYKTRLVPLLVQALKAIGQENMENEHFEQIKLLIHREPDLDALKRDATKAPDWIRKIIEPLVKKRIEDELD